MVKNDEKRIRNKVIISYLGTVYNTKEKLSLI
jgi:hypothetical protein